MGGGVGSGRSFGDEGWGGAVLNFLPLNGKDYMGGIDISTVENRNFENRNLMETQTGRA